MNSAKWKTVKEVFTTTLDLPESERESFLADYDAGICEEVRNLLAAHFEAEDFIAAPFFTEKGIAEDETKDSFIGKQIENYLISEKIGAGGMGAVYLAERINSDFKGKVALKLIKRGMDSDAILKHFATERRILSTLKHPNIAGLLDGGISSEGLPFFVMEYVDGKPLNQFCRENHLSLEERLEIFRRICAAVEYAHKNLVVHRDLKPSNVVVTEDGTPKLLDFGIAKLLADDESETTVTMTQGKMFTPEYASPEQILGKNVTTATDVYSLGVILYELLSQHRPFDVKGKSYDEIVRSICETEPPRPSETRESHPLTTETEPENLQIPKDRLRGDLDNIVLKAMRKEPSERYGSVQQFSEDISRFLKGLPIFARPQTLKYRFGKYVKRHRAGVFAAALVLISLLGGISVATWQAVVARRERAKAEQRFNQARELAHTVLFEYHDQIKGLPGATAVREKLVTDSLKYLNNLAQGSDNPPDLQREIVGAFRKVGDIQGSADTTNLGKTEAALSSYRKALEIQEQLAAGNPANLEDRKMLARLYLDVGQQTSETGDLAETENNYRKALDIFSEVQRNQPDDVKTQADLARVWWHLAGTARAKNDFDGALENYRRTLEIYQNLAVSDSSNKKHRRNIALTYKTMGAVLQLKHESAQALELFQKALAIDTENAAADANDVSAQLDLSFTLGSLGSVFRDTQNYVEAVENYRKALIIRQKVFAADAKNVMAEMSVARAYKEIGITLLHLRQNRAAQKNLEQAASIYESLVASDQTNANKKNALAETLTALGEAFYSADNPIAAAEKTNKAAAIYDDLSANNKDFAQDKSDVAAVRQMLAKISMKRKDAAATLENYRQALAILGTDSAPDKTPEELARTAEIYEGIADAQILSKSGAENLNEAKAAYRKSLDIWQDLERKGKLTPGNNNSLVQVSQKLAKCETTLTKLQK